MFTGLVETTGTVLSSQSDGGAWRLVISAPRLSGRWHVGDSIAVNGVCLTALEVPDNRDTPARRFAADLAAETVERTTLAQLQPGALVNLELPTPAGAPLGGHVVQGHVDGTGTLISLIALHPGVDTSDWRMTVEVPQDLVANIIPQGSVTIDGISLTVARMDGRRIEIAIIPHTYKSTNLRSLLAGSPVNIEADVLAKYAAKRAEAHSAAALAAKNQPIPSPPVAGQSDTASAALPEPAAPTPAAPTPAAPESAAPAPAAPERAIPAPAATLPEQPAPLVAAPEVPIAIPAAVTSAPAFAAGHTAPSVPSPSLQPTSSGWLTVSYLLANGY